MGNQAINLSQIETQWVKIKDQSSFVLWEHKNTKEHFQQHSVEEKYSSEAVQLIEKRKNHETLINAFSLSEEVTCSCEILQKTIFVEKTPHCLKDIKSVPFLQALRLYKHCFHGFGTLSSVIGFFHVDESMVVLNEKKVPKVWHRKEYFLNNHQNYQYEISEAAMVSQVNQMLRRKIDFNTFPTQYIFPFENNIQGFYCSFGECLQQLVSFNINYDLKVPLQLKKTSFYTGLQFDTGVTNLSRKQQSQKLSLVIDYDQKQQFSKIPDYNNYQKASYQLSQRSIIYKLIPYKRQQNCSFDQNQSKILSSQESVQKNNFYAQKPVLTSSTCHSEYKTQNKQIMDKSFSKNEFFTSNQITRTNTRQISPRSFKKQHITQNNNLNINKKLEETFNFPKITFQNYSCSSTPANYVQQNQPSIQKFFCRNPIKKENYSNKVKINYFQSNQCDVNAFKFKKDSAQQIQKTPVKQKKQPRTQEATKIKYRRESVKRESFQQMNNMIRQKLQKKSKLIINTNLNFAQRNIRPQQQISYDIIQQSERVDSILSFKESIRSDSMQSSKRVYRLKTQEKIAQ